VTRIFPRASLMDEVTKIAREDRGAPAGAILECRRLVERGEERVFADAVVDENNVLASRYGSEENVAAVMAFLARRSR